MADDFKLLSVDQWNAWWKSSYENKDGEKDSGHSKYDETYTPQANPLLGKHIQALSKGRTTCKVFVPLCGNSPDMKWLLDNGFEVVGIDCSEHALLKFYDDNQIEYDKSTSAVDPSFTAFKAKNANMCLYQGDFFKFNHQIGGGLCDAIWDTASLNTIAIEDRERYVEICLSLMEQDMRYMLSGMFFGDKKTWINNPFDLSEADVEKLFGGRCTWEILDKDDTEWGLEHIYLMKYK